LSPEVRARRKVIAMVRRSLDAVVEGDAAGATSTSDDDRLAALLLYATIQMEIRKDVPKMEMWIQLLSSSAIWRIADNQYFARRNLHGRRRSRPASSRQ
jgi:hypothetical protein